MVLYPWISHVEISLLLSKGMDHPTIDLSLIHICHCRFLGVGWLTMRDNYRNLLFKCPYMKSSVVHKSRSFSQIILNVRQTAGNFVS